MIPSVEDGVILLLRGSLDPDPPLAAALVSVLSPEERRKAENFRIDTVRRRYLMTRGWIRVILGELTGHAPAELEFAHGPQGKPGLAGGPSFNLSHAGDHILVGVTSVGDLGVDIEDDRGAPDLEQVAARVFASSELEAFLALDDMSRRAAFYRIWTRKEALLKAAGGGLSLPLQSFGVASEERDGQLLHWMAPEFIASLGSDSDTRDWWVASVPRAAPPAGAAAVAWDRGPARVRIADLPGAHELQTRLHRNET